MTRSLYEPSTERSVVTNRFYGKDTRQRPFAGLWIFPVNDADCPPVAGDPHPFGASVAGYLYEWTPCLLNDWLQVDPDDANLEPFAFRAHYDGSLEFMGHLDASGGATSGTVALILPGIMPLEPDYIDLLDHTQMWETIITDDAGTSFSPAMVRIDAITGEVTITWPPS